MIWLRICHINENDGHFEPLIEYTHPKPQSVEVAYNIIDNCRVILSLIILLKSCLIKKIKTSF